MKTKQTLLNTGALLLIGFACTAQSMGPHHNKREQIEAHKIAFITKQLELTPEEAQAFWPVYNQCRKQREDFRKKNREQFSAKGGSLTLRQAGTLGEKDKRKNLDEMSDKEVEIMVDKEFVIKQRDLDLQKECYAKYKQVLPIKKVAKLYRAEKEFKRILLKKMQERAQPSHRPGPLER